jgi:ribonuclease P/MRP protein subunit RPP40
MAKHLIVMFFINNNDCACNSILKLFADDLKVYSIFDVSHDCNFTNNHLQETIDKVCEWATKWQFTVNVRKCSALYVNNKLTTVKRPYFITGIVLPIDNSVCDLGVLTDDKLSYKGHINLIVSKAMQRLGLLFRGFLCRDISFLRRAFVTYIRPLVEYCSVVWSPCLKKYIDILEKVQKKFSKRIPCLRGLSYTERLARLNLQPLELRRLQFDLIFYYNILNNQSSIDKDEFFTFHVPPLSSRHPIPFIQKPKSATNHLLSSFRYRSVDCWNSLSLEVQNATSIKSFKTALIKTDLSSFLYGSAFTALSDFSAIF